MKDLAAVKELKGIHPHQLRHTCATELVVAGMDSMLAKRMVRIVLIESLPATATAPLISRGKRHSMSYMEARIKIAKRRPADSGQCLEDAEDSRQSSFRMPSE